jgi:hypothetical protein
MKTELKVEVPTLKMFKIDASRCDLRVGDHVISETTVGEDFATRELVRAECSGVVEAVNWSADDHALFVWVRPSRP